LPLAAALVGLSVLPFLTATLWTMTQVYWPVMPVALIALFLVCLWQSLDERRKVKGESLRPGFRFAYPCDDRSKQALEPSEGYPYVGALGVGGHVGCRCQVKVFSPTLRLRVPSPLAGEGQGEGVYGSAAAAHYPPFLTFPHKGLSRVGFLRGKRHIVIHSQFCSHILGAGPGLGYEAASRQAVLL